MAELGNPTGGFWEIQTPNNPTGEFWKQESQDDPTWGFWSTEEISNSIPSITFESVIQRLQNHEDSTFRAYADVLIQLEESLWDKNLNEVQKTLELISESDDSDQILRYIEDLRNIQIQYNNEANDIRQQTSEWGGEIRDENLQTLLAEARWIELTWHIETWEWAEVMPRIQTELNSLNIELSNEELTQFEEIFKLMKAQADSLEIWLQNTNGILDNILDQAEQHGENTPFSVSISQNNFIEEWWSQSIGFISNFTSLPWWIPGQEIPSSFDIEFPSAEIAINFVLWVKQSLKEIESINLYDWSVDLLIDALVFWVEWIWEIDKFVLNFIKEDLEYTFGSGLWIGAWSLAVHGIAYFYLKTKLDAANSGIKPEAITELENNLRETIRLYKSAWFEDEDIRNMEGLLRELTEFFPETPEWINEQRFRAKYVYSVLQKWRWSVPMDAVRFGASGVGRIFDNDLSNWSDSLIRKVKIPLLNIPVWEWLHNLPLLKHPIRGLDWIARLHLLPVNLGAKLINKWPNWWRIFNTKSSVINDYVEGINNANETFSRFFSIIDNISEFSADERTALKREILELYRSSPITKLDPLMERSFSVNIDFVWPEKRQLLFARLQDELTRIWKPQQVTNIQEFRAWVRELPMRRFRYYKGLIDSFLALPSIWTNLDLEAARILSSAIEWKIWYVPTHIEDTFSSIRRNGEIFENERANIEAKRSEFLRFVEYYPGISDIDEQRLSDISSIEALTARNAENFKTQMVQVLQNEFNITVTKEYIKTFWDMVENESMNTGRNRNNGIIIEKIDDILLTMKDSGTISEVEYSERLNIAQSFFTGNKTFWQAHLWLITQKIINGERPSWTSTLDEVNGFLSNGWSRDVMTQLRSIQRDISQNTTTEQPETPRTTDIEVPTETEESPVENTERTSTRTRWVEVFFDGEELKPNGNARALFAVSFQTGIPLWELRALIPPDTTWAGTRDAINNYLSGKSEYRMLTTLSDDALRDIQVDFITRAALSSWSDISSDIVERIIWPNFFEPPERLGQILNIDTSSVPEWDTVITGVEWRISPEILSDLRDVSDAAWNRDGVARWRAILDIAKRIWS